MKTPPYIIFSAATLIISLLAFARANAQPCSGTPPVPEMSAPTNVLSGVSFWMSSYDSSGTSGITRQWEMSTDAVTWTPIAGATDTFFNTTQTIPTYYRMCFTCSNSGLTSCSDPHFVDIDLCTYPPVIQLDTIPATCAGNDGALSIVNVTGGVPPYSYVWNTGEIGAAIESLSAGEWYDVTVTDSEGCFDVQSTYLTGGDTLYTYFNVDSSTGVVNVSTTVSGGTPPYLYSWNNGANTEDLNDIPTGIYCVTITDMNGCSVSNCVNTNSYNPCATAFIAVYFETDNYFALEMSSTAQNWNGGRLWAFGDGTSDTSLYPSHNYAANDIYQVCLYLLNANGTTNCSYCHNIGFDSAGNVVTRMDLTGFGMQVVPFGSLGVEETPLFAVDVYPNPVADVASLKLTSNTTGTGTVDIYNSIGQRAKTFSFAHNTGSNTVQMPLRDLSNGLYVITVRTNDGQTSRTFTK